MITFEQDQARLILNYDGSSLIYFRIPYRGAAGFRACRGITSNARTPAYLDPKGPSAPTVQGQRGPEEDPA